MILLVFCIPVGMSYYQWWDGIDNWYLPLLILFLPMSLFPLYRYKTGVNFGGKIKFKEND